MAARKSCTHLTWSDAKAKSNPGGGGAGGGSGLKKNKNAPKQAHNLMLAAKIIAKNGASQQEINQHKAAERRAIKEEKKALEIAQKRKEEREQERQSQVVKPSERAQERMSILALRLQEQACITDATTTSTTASTTEDNVEEMKNIVECREMQLQELMALEAMFNIETDACRTLDASMVEELREKIENVNVQQQEDDDYLDLLRSVVRHPPLSFTLELNVDDDDNRASGQQSFSGLELTAAILLKVSLPPHYPLYGDDDDDDESSSPTDLKIKRLPDIEIIDVMVTDRAAVCTPDKPLESLAFINDQELKQAMMSQALLILPDPCIYEVAVTWLSENVFDFITLRPHASISTS